MERQPPHTRLTDLAVGRNEGRKERGAPRKEGCQGRISRMSRKEGRNG
jgi:hypothetical protein